MLKKADFEEFNRLLLALRARVRGDVQQMTDEALDRNEEGEGESKSPTHLAELGTETYELDFALRRVENEQEFLAEIDAALLRIKDESFGICQGCQTEGRSLAKSVISKLRLRAIPYTKNCVECEQKREASEC